jgi:hypothetical protein
MLQGMMLNHQETPCPGDGTAADSRAAPRSSFYLTAGLYWDGSYSPVKIRNMSASGALIEAGAAPGAGSLVQLVRGTLIAHALVAWSAEGRCGLRFSGRVDVQQWRVNPSSAEQQRVDEVVRLVKAGAVPLPVPPLSDADMCTETADGGEHLARDLRRAAQLLDLLGDALANDAAVVERHGSSLQNLDIATQVLAAVEAILAGLGDPDATKLSGLRRSADQAILRNGDRRGAA